MLSALESRHVQRVQKKSRDVSTSVDMTQRRGANNCRREDGLEVVGRFCETPKSDRRLTPTPYNYPAAYPPWM